MDIAGTSSPAKEYLYKLEEYKKQASTRKDAHKRLSLETGLSSNSFRLAASEEGSSKNWSLSQQRLFGRGRISSCYTLSNVCTSEYAT